jgi:hypothetical protein
MKKGNRKLIHSYLNHLYRDHSELTTLTNDMVIGQLMWTTLAVQEIIGVTPRLMRPVSLEHYLILYIILNLLFSLVVTLTIVCVTLSNS